MEYAAWWMQPLSSDVFERKKSISRHSLALTHFADTDTLAHRHTHTHLHTPTHLDELNIHFQRCCDLFAVGDCAETSHPKWTNQFYQTATWKLSDGFRKGVRIGWEKKNTVLECFFFVLFSGRNEGMSVCTGQCRLIVYVSQMRESPSCPSTYLHHASILLRRRSSEAKHNKTKI